MKKSFESYRRLARGLFSCSSLWAGPDHFVYVKGMGVLMPFFEEYKRFRFEDVHAITMARTKLYLWTTVLYGLGAAMSAALIFLPDYDPDGRIVMAVLFSPVLVFCFLSFLVTLARGPSCRCRIETSVGSVVIRPLSRLRRSKRVLEEMSGLVRGVQGGEYPEETGEGELEDAGAGAPEPEAETPAEKAAERRMERSVFLMPTFLLLALFGGLWIAHAYAMHWWPLPILGLLELLVFLGVSVSLVQQMRTYTPGMILGVLWTAMAQQFVIMGAAFMMYLYWSVQLSVLSSGNELMSVSGLYEQAETVGVVYYFSVINGVMSWILGLGGAALVWRNRARMRLRGSPPALPTPGNGGR